MNRNGAMSALVDRRVLRWSLFDVASSTFAAVVPPFFGLYFVAVVAPTHPGSVAVWGFLVAAALLVAGTLAPVAGAVADRTGRWLTVLSATTAACVGLTLLLAQSGHGHALVACGSFLLALIAYTLATSTYDSLLVRIAPGGRRGLASGIGWALGLCGGFVAVATALAFVHDLPASAQIQRLPGVFMSTGILFGLLAVPALLALRGLRTRGEGKAVSRSSLGESVGKVRATLRDWRRHRKILRVLASFFLINDVLVTLQFFLTIMLSTRYGLTVEGLLKLALVFHAIAIPSTIIAGALADHWGGRRTVAGLSAILAAALLLMTLSTSAWVPLVAVALFGLVFGSLQSVFRSLYASLVEADRAAEFFGFNSLAGRVSTAAGPAIFGAAAAVLGSQPLALVTLLVPLAAGVLLLVGLEGDTFQSRIRPPRPNSLAEGATSAVSAKHQRHDPL